MSLLRTQRCRCQPGLDSCPNWSSIQLCVCPAACQMAASNCGIPRAASSICKVSFEPLLCIALAPCHQPKHPCQAIPIIRDAPLLVLRLHASPHPLPLTSSH